jgi:hypothetical protein
LIAPYTPSLCWTSLRDPRRSTSLPLLHLAVLEKRRSSPTQQCHPRQVRKGTLCIPCSPGAAAMSKFASEFHEIAVSLRSSPYSLRHRNALITCNLDCCGANMTQKRTSRTQFQGDLAAYSGSRATHGEPLFRPSRKGARPPCQLFVGQGRDICVVRTAVTMARLALVDAE